MAKGLVIKSTGSWYTVQTENKNLLNCKIRGKLRIGGIVTTNPVAVGDQVEYEFIEKEKIGFINKIHERKNYIIRRSINLSKKAHIIAANVDNAFLFITIAFPETSTQFIDRFLISAEAYRIPVILLFNKEDLYNDKQISSLNELKKIYEDIGYKCLIISAINKKNTEMVKDLCHGRINVFAGNSGVGKSTLINVLYPGMKLKTKEISEYHLKGKHTTTFSEMIELKSGGYIIDTPGIKGFGFVDIFKEELYHFFPEIFRVSKNCKYNNCTHIHEPSCAVIDAVKSGKISESRYDNYYNMYMDDDSRYRLANKAIK